MSGRPSATWIDLPESGSTAGMARSRATSIGSDQVSPRSVERHAELVEERPRVVPVLHDRPGFLPRLPAVGAPGEHRVAPEGEGVLGVRIVGEPRLSGPLPREVDVVRVEGV